jgi:hypothetical protein
MSEENVSNRGATEFGKRQVGLEMKAKFWATSNAHDGRRPGADISSTQGGNLNREAANWTSLLPDPEAPSGRTCWCGVHGCAQRSHRRKLNAMFTTWAMGWPFFWLAKKERTPYARQEMELWRSKVRQALSGWFEER